jgi:hypothetical protein
MGNIKHFRHLAWGYEELHIEIVQQQPGIIGFFQVLVWFPQPHGGVQESTERSLFLFGLFSKWLSGGVYTNTMLDSSACQQTRL